jgi:hypothetical protein
MSVRRASTTATAPRACIPCGAAGGAMPTGPALMFKFTPRKPAPLATDVGLNELPWVDNKGEDIDCTICAWPMKADSGENPWTGPGMFLTQACVNGHIFHKGCLLTSMDRDPNLGCPMCKDPILKEVAESLRRGGAPAPVPPPRPSAAGGGGGLFRGGGGGGGGGGLFGPVDDGYRVPSQEELDRIREYDRQRSIEQQQQARMEHEARRVAQLRDPTFARSLEPAVRMTGVNGHFFLVGRTNENPRPLEIVQGMRDGPYGVNVPGGQVYADHLYVTTSQQNLDPFHGMIVTLVTYEFNGLTDEQGDNFRRAYYETEDFYKRFFGLSRSPLVGTNGAPKWGEEPMGVPPTLNISPEAYDAWARAEQELQDLRAQLREAEAEEEEEPPGPRTRARAAAEARAAAAREEREQLDDF